MYSSNFSILFALFSLFVSFILIGVRSGFTRKNVLDAQYFVEKLKLLLSYFFVSVVYQSTVEFSNVLESVSDETLEGRCV
jgi:hypothetical protein